jgi:hypothetical protein
MKKLRFACILGLLAGNLFAQKINALERDQLQARRADYEVVFGKAEIACYQKFAVTDCLRTVKAERRVVMDELRRQEILLNDVERQTNAIAEIDRIQANNSPQTQASAALARSEAVEAYSQRLKRSDEKRSQAAIPKASSAVGVQKDLPKSEADKAISLKNYTDKQKEASQRKIDKAKSLQDKIPGEFKPLPTPN